MTGDHKKMFEVHNLLPSHTTPCPWVALGQSCGGSYCVLCAAIGQLGPQRMWTDAGGQYVLTIDLESDDLVGTFWSLAQLQRTVAGLKVSATDWGRGRLLLFRRADAEAVA